MIAGAAIGAGMGTVVRRLARFRVPGCPLRAERRWGDPAGWCWPATSDAAAGTAEPVPDIALICSGGTGRENQVALSSSQPSPRHDGQSCSGVSMPSAIDWRSSDCAMCITDRTIFWVCTLSTTLAAKLRSILTTSASTRSR